MVRNKIELKHTHKRFKDKKRNIMLFLLFQNVQILASEYNSRLVN